TPRKPSGGGLVLYVTATWSPASLNAAAIASPIPRLPPVTNTDLPTSPPHPSPHGPHISAARTLPRPTPPHTSRVIPCSCSFSARVKGGEGATRRDNPACAAARRAGSSGVFEAEADLHADLVVVDLVVDDVAADLGDLEPVEVTQGLAGAGDAVGDGLVDALLGGANDLRDAVGAIGHATFLSILAARGRAARRTVVLAEEDRCRDTVSGPAKPSFR